MFGQRVELSPSVTLAAAISVAHIGAAVLLWIVPVPTVVQAVLTLAVVVSFVYFMARDATLHAPHSVIALEVGEDGRIAAQTRSGRWLDCELLGSSTVSARLTVVNLRPRGRRLGVRVVLVSDNVDPRDFRWLRTWLRWKGGATGTVPDEVKI